MVLLNAIVVVAVVAALLPLAAIARALVTVALESQVRSLHDTVGLVLSFVALGFGSFFFAYSVRYYLACILVLLATYMRRNGAAGNGGKAAVLPVMAGSTRSAALTRFAGPKGNGHARAGANGNGNSNGDFSLPEWPFVCVQIASYNEKRVIGRLLEACAKLEYPNYEVILVDDSNDTSAQIVAEWKDHPGFKVIQRSSRDGYKGGALTRALEVMDPRTEYVMILDADAVPFPDAIQCFLPHFYFPNGHHPEGPERRPNVAAVQSYQWHVLNKSESWLTEAVRTEYAGSYMVERTLQEVMGAMKMIAGTAYMIRADLLKETGWGTSLTEDWELTLKLYEKGYKVAYTPYAEVPAECVGTFARLARQRMRWAEGHSFNVRRYFLPIVRSRKLGFWEKFEFLYFSVYYLQAVFLVIGTVCWLVAELVLHVHIPTWTALLGWSLLFTNLVALPVLNLTGLFLEGAPGRDFGGIAGAVALSMLLVPFQGWAALKGLFEKDEGPWHRTPKTGAVTDTVSHMRRMKGLRKRLELTRRRRPVLQALARRLPALQAATDSVPKASRVTRRIWMLIAALSLAAGGLGVAAWRAPAGAAGPALYMHHGTGGTNGYPLMDFNPPNGAPTDFLMLDGSSVTWSTEVFYANGTVPAGNWSFTFWWADSNCGAGANSCKINVSVGLLSACNGGTCATQSQAFAFPQGQISGQTSGSQTFTTNPGALAVRGCPCALYLTISVVSTHGKTFHLLFDGASAPTNLSAAIIPVPEHGFGALLGAALLLPVVLRLRRRPARRRARDG